MHPLSCPTLQINAKISRASPWIIILMVVFCSIETRAENWEGTIFEAVFISTSSSYFFVHSCKENHICSLVVRKESLEWKMGIVWVFQWTMRNSVKFPFHVYKISISTLCMQLSSAWKYFALNGFWNVHIMFDIGWSCCKCSSWSMRHWYFAARIMLEPICYDDFEVR